MELEVRLAELEQEYIELKRKYEEKKEELYKIKIQDLEIALIIYKLEEKKLINFRDKLASELQKLK